MKKARLSLFLSYKYFIYLLLNCIYSFVLELAVVSSGVWLI